MKYLLEKDGEVIYNALDPVLSSYEWDVQMALGFIIGCFHRRRRSLEFEELKAYAREGAASDADELQAAIPEAWQKLIDLGLIFEAKRKE